jgi:RNA polymerase sigma factor (TIGR02999 family)
MSASPGQVTILLNRLKEGRREVEAELLPLVYKELQRIAASYMRNENAGHTLQPTALVNEAYLRLTDQTRVDWKSRAHFLGVAAQLMRRILVDHVRERLARKRGGHQVRIDVEHVQIEKLSERPEDVLAVDEALSRLSHFDPRQARIVEMRYFGGLTVEETAEALSISPRTVKREWAMARAWLRAEISGRPDLNDA